MADEFDAIAQQIMARKHAASGTAVFLDETIIKQILRAAWQARRCETCQHQRPPSDGYGNIVACTQPDMVAASCSSLTFRLDMPPDQFSCALYTARPASGQEPT